MLKRTGIEVEFTHNSTAIEGILDDFTNMLAKLEEAQHDQYISLIPNQNQLQQM